MKTLLILLTTVLLSFQLIAENIDERKTDIYFANGVGAISKDKSFRQGSVQIKAYKKANPDIKKWIGKYDLAFNIGRGIIPDFFEAWLQYTDESPNAAIIWLAFKVAIGRLTGIGDKAINLSEAITRQYEADDITPIIPYQIRQQANLLYN